MNESNPDTPPGPPPPTTTCPTGVSNNTFTGCYYDNKDFTNFKGSRSDGQLINFDWGQGVPHPDIAQDEFSVRWEGNFNFSETGTYRFLITTDDGFRLYIDDVLRYDTWILQSATQYDHTKVDIPIEKGKHKIRVDYFENQGYSVAKLSWQPL